MSIYDTGHELVDELKKLQDLLSSITDKFINKKDPEEDENIFETGTKEERDNKVKLALAIAAVSALVFVYRR